MRAFRSGAREGSPGTHDQTRFPVLTMTAANTVQLSGEFDMAATFTVEPALERMLETPDLDLITLDLSAVTFIDSVGVGVVTRFAREAEARGAALRIVPGPPEVQRVFEIAGLAEVLPFEQSSGPTRR